MVNKFVVVIKNNKQIKLMYFCTVGPPSIAPILDSPTFLDFDQSYDDEGNDVLLSSKDDKKNRTEPKVDGQPKKFIAQKGQKTTVKKLEKIQGRNEKISRFQMIAKIHINYS